LDSHELERQCLRPATCSRDPEISSNKKTFYIYKDRNGSREQVAGRSVYNTRHRTSNTGRRFLISFFFLCKIILFIGPLCYPAYGAPRFLTLSDIHYGSKNSSNDGQDTGPEFFKIMLNKFKELSQTVDFILFLGDIPTHSLFNGHKAEYEKMVFHELYQNDEEAKPLFYIFGNNDSLKGNYQAFEFNGISPLNYATDWNGACAHCTGLIIDKSHMNRYGYYSSYVIPNNKDIILIALNTTPWAKIPGLKSVFFPKYDHQEQQALAQLDWLEQQLKEHHAKQLLIAMHIPPGSSFLGVSFWYKEYTQRFINILSKYAQQYGQISLLSGHTHMEEFRKIKLNNGTHVYIYSTPGISRIHHNYPAMKVFILDNNLHIKDFITYYTNTNYQWNDQQYRALSLPDPILPECQDKTLAQCLDKLTVDQLCDYLYRGKFYGVKSPNVPDSFCKITYSVN
jgi:predicted phosphodiesterase